MPNYGIKDLDLKTKNNLRVAAILAVGIAISWLVIISKPTPKLEKHQEAPPHLADVVSVILEPHAITVLSQGTVTPKIETDITSQVSGEVISVGDHFAAGGFFMAEEVLLAIDPRDYEITLVRAKASLAEAKNALAQQEGIFRQVKREWRDLGDKEANDLFLRKPQLAAARANVNASEADIRQARLNLERTRISLPFDGRMVGVDANLGQYINAGTKVASVFASDIMEVRLPLSAGEMTLLNLQVDVKQRDLKPLTVSLHFSAGHHLYEWQGMVVRVEASVDIKSRLFYLVAEIDNSRKKLFETDKLVKQPPILPGTFVEASITSNPHDNVMILPRSALYQSDQVLVLDKENRLRLQKVVVLQLDSEKLVVKGLENGQQVLAKPPIFMDIGAVYTPVPFPIGDNEA